MILEEISTLEDYELIDSGDSYRLERFGNYVLSRPDPAVLWKRTQSESIWNTAQALFVKGNAEEKGNWKNSGVPEKWPLRYSKGKKHEITFYAELSPFKHTGVFPEQSANWDFIVEKVEKAKHGNQKLRFLNLFGYTGIASVLAAKLGCEVTHVDASKPSMDWAHQNMVASGLPDDAIRWILDDCLKFVKREAKRGKKYDAIILDPPAFGRGAKGEVWKFNEDLPVLLETLKDIVSDEFKFLVINAYAVSVSSLLLKNLLDDFKQGVGGSEDRKIDYGELVIKERSGRLLSTGIFARLY